MSKIKYIIIGVVLYYGWMAFEAFSVTFDLIEKIAK